MPKKRPKPGKGSAYEREFCKKLSLWWSNGRREDIFWRTSQSGGRATTRAKKDQTTVGQYGDIAATDPIGAPLMEVVTIELKRGYPRATIHDLLDKSNGAAQQQFEKWVEQVRESARLASSFSWMLVTKRDRRESLVWIPKSLATKLSLQHFGGIMGPNFNSDRVPANEFPTAFLFYFITLDDWIRCIKPNQIKALAREHQDGWESTKEHRK